jgi:hypothetical protein
MSQGSTEQGTQGQESGTEQGQNGSTGQESGTEGGQGQESGTQQETGTPDLTSITDPVLRGWVEQQAQQAAEARREAARYRTERNTLQTKVTEAQRASETEQQRVERENQERQDRLDALERENRDLKVGSAIRDAAKDARAHNPQRVVDLLNAKVELDDEGKPKNLQDLLKDLRKSDPYLFKRAGSQDAGEGNGDDGAPTGTINDTIRGMARRGRSTT